MIQKNKAFNILVFLFKPHKKLVTIYLAVLILYSILEIFRLSLIYPIINYGLDVNTSSTVIDTFYQSVLPQNINPFVAYALLLAIITLVIAVIEIGVAYLGSKTFSIVRDYTDRSVFEAIKNQPYEYFAKHKQGDLIYVGQQAVNTSGSIILSFVLFIQNVILCLFYLVFIFFISFELSIVIFLFGLVYVLLIKKHLYSRIYRDGKILNTAAIGKSIIYNEFISGVKTILITDSVQFWAKKYDNAVRKLLNSYTRVQVLNRVPKVMNNLLIFMFISLGALGLYYFTGGNFLSYVGIFGTFMFALYRLVPALNVCQTQFATITQNLPALESVYDTLQEGKNNELKQENINKKTFAFKRLISFQNVFFRYGAGLDDTINNLSFDIEKNTKVAIVGNSGAGKTTIANLLALLYQPTAGSILVDGTDLNEFSTSGYLKTLGYLGQETFVYHDTIKENIRFGLDCTDEEIIEAAKLADAHKFIMETPEGYDTIIGDQGMKLSGGQRQRVAIARVILRKPEILLLDEATSSLDNISEQRVMESVDRISENMTVIIIAHRLSTVQNADVIFVLKDGSVYESGTHNELLEKKGEYFNLYLNQSERRENENS